VVNISEWLVGFMSALRNTFGSRVIFIGLQGSYARNEATEKSDIDTVVILDKLTVEDINTYNEMLDTLAHRELICGFVSGKDELYNWEPSDLFQFYNDTKPLYGNLESLLPIIDKKDVERAIKTGACNIYHGCVHNMLYEKSEELLKGLYKSASFVIQAAVYMKTGEYVRCQDDLLNKACDCDKKIITGFLDIKRGSTMDFQKAAADLFDWAKKKINEKFDL